MMVYPKSVTCPVCNALIGQSCIWPAEAAHANGLSHPARVAEAKRRVEPIGELDFIRSLTPTERSAYYDFRQQQKRWHCGLLFRPGSLWIGIHWSKNNKRWCINLIPCITFWVTKPGGKMP